MVGESASVSTSWSSASAAACLYTALSSGRRFNPQPRHVVVSGERMGSEELTEAAQRAYPEHTASIFVEREDPSRAVTVSIDRDGKRLQRLFDPYTGEDLGHALPLGWRLDHVAPRPS